MVFNWNYTSDVSGWRAWATTQLLASSCMTGWPFNYSSLAFPASASLITMQIHLCKPILTSLLPEQILIQLDVVVITVQAAVYMAVQAWRWTTQRFTAGKWPKCHKVERPEAEHTGKDERTGWMFPVWHLKREFMEIDFLIMLKY